MNRYTKKPVTIEAAQWDGTDDGATPIIQWVLDNEGTARYYEALPPAMHTSHCRCDGMGIVPGSEGSAVACPETEPQGPGEPTYIAIDTLEGTMKAAPGWWIIRAGAGEFYPCDPAIFDVTYDVEVGHGWGWAREDRTFWHLPTSPDGDSDTGPLDGPLLETDRRQANMVGSLLDNGRHSPVLDLDYEARLVPSSTPGHYHLFLDGLELDHDAYLELTAALVAAKVIQSGFRRRLIESGTTLARLHRDKTPGDPTPGPIVCITDPPAEAF